MRTFLLLFLFAGLTDPLFARTWAVTIPDHDETFAYGSEQSHRGWIVTSNGTLAVVLSFTNDPYVDRVTPRMYNTFTLDFPSIRLGPDHQTFYYHPAGGPHVPVAEMHSVIFGLRHVSLLPSSNLLVNDSRGLVSATLLIGFDLDAFKMGQNDTSGDTP